MARRFLGVCPAWTADLERSSRYTEFTLEPCTKSLVTMVARPGRLRFVRDKYSREAYDNVATLCAAAALAPHAGED